MKKERVICHYYYLGGNGVGFFVFARAAFINSRGFSYLGNTYQIRDKKQRMSQVCNEI